MYKRQGISLRFPSEWRKAWRRYWFISPQHGRKERCIGTHPHERTLETAFERPKDWRHRWQWGFTGSAGSLEKRSTTDMTEKKILRIILCLKQMLPSFWMNCFPKVPSKATDTLKPVSYTHLYYQRRTWNHGTRTGNLQARCRANRLEKRRPTGIEWRCV